MADHITLAAQPRTVTGKKVSQLRRQGITPIVVYGRHTQPVALQAETKTLTRVLASAGSSRLIEISVEGESEPRVALARDAQRHVTKLSLLHADFLQVAMDETVRSDVPIEIVGESPPVRANEALLDVPVTSVSVEALPADLPSTLPIDISGMEEIGDMLTAADIAVGEGVTILDDPEEIIVRISQLARVVAAAEEELEEGEIAAEVEGEEAPAEDAEAEEADETSDEEPA